MGYITKQKRRFSDRISRNYVVAAYDGPDQGLFLERIEVEDYGQHMEVIHWGMTKDPDKAERMTKDEAIFVAGMIARDKGLEMGYMIMVSTIASELREQVARATSAMSAASAAPADMEA